MNPKLTNFMISVTCTVALALLATQAHAVPAFSRAHKVECTTCHTIAPELNEYGDAFLKNSYVFLGKAKKGEKKEAAPAPAAPKPKASGTSTGAAANISGEGDPDKLSKLKAGAMAGEAAGSEPAAAATEPLAAAAAPTETKSEGLVLAAIPELLPISFTGAINYGFGDKRNINDGNEFDYSARSFKLHAAGNFRDMVGFFATYVAYSEQPPGGTYNTSIVPSNNKTDLSEFFIQWRNAFDTPINIKIGRVQPKLGLWKTNNKLSATNNYLPYTYTVGTESVFRVEQTQDTLELNSVLAKRLFVAGGLVNRKGQNSKEGYAHVSYKFGGADYMGGEPDVDLNKDESVFDFLTFTVGTYGYLGKNGSSVSGTPRNNYGRGGVDTELQYKIFRLRTLGGYGYDDNATPSQTRVTKVISKAATIEGEFTLRTNLIAATRFEYLQEVGNVPASVFTNVYARRYIGTLGYTPLENLKLSTEFKYEIMPTVINRVGIIGATFSF